MITEDVAKEIVQEIEQNIEWFCDKIVEPVPINHKDKEKILYRMKALGWVRQAEIDMYNELTKED